LPGTVDVWVNGEYALSFTTDEEPGVRVVEREGYRWVFVPKSVDDEKSGIVYFTIPSDKVTPGQPLELRAKHAAGDPHAWFAVKAYPDTAEFEHVTPESAAAIGQKGK
jgi:hypothetical protein